jgi:hypothetical protein
MLRIQLPSHGAEAPVKLSVVVVVYNMPREAPRTLFSLSTAYQLEIDRDDYEVIVVENGSTQPLDAAEVAALPGHFRYFRLDAPSPSPAPAVNFGLRQVRGEVVGVMIDGARLASPGLFHFALVGAHAYPRAIVASLGWYLGREYQRHSIEYGYDHAREDALLESIEWPKDGYRLHEIATLDESSCGGWFLAIAESNALFMRRALWTELEGLDERFDFPGGGLVNLDTLSRACALPNTELVVLLGEGTFHQVHGGVATNASLPEFETKMSAWMAQYRALRGKEWALPLKRRTYLGWLPPSVLPHFVNTGADAAYNRLFTEVSQVVRERDLVLNSVSFRITAPLRMAAKWARAGRSWWRVKRPPPISAERPAASGGGPEGAGFHG